VQITLDEIEAHRPDVLLPPDPEFAEDYAEAVKYGREVAAGLSIAIVMICRNSQPWLRQTLDLIERTGACFKSWTAFAAENDSVDDTKEVLKEWSDQRQRCVSLNTYDRPHLNYTISQERTVALAEYRAACQTWVRHGEPVDLVAVVDSDSWGGWSIDGLLTSVAHMERSDWWGLGSYSWCEMRTADGTVIPAHYDGFAFRWFGWRHRTPLDWFHLMRPVVGAPPVQVNSAFGQLALYRADAYLRGVYTGETCEHCTLHRSIAEHPETRGRFGFNPSSRVVSFWVPQHGRQHLDH
jgi:hypothetical protein